MVGSARVKYKVPAPATTGDPIFERYFRVQQNTMEQLVLFVPAIFVFATYVHMIAAASLGFVFVIARAVYAMGYVKDPEKRAGGAVATFLVNTILVGGGLIYFLASPTSESSCRVRPASTDRRVLLRALPPGLFCESEGSLGAVNLYTTSSERA